MFYIMDGKIGTHEGENFVADFQKYTVSGNRTWVVERTDTLGHLLTDLFVPHTIGTSHSWIEMGKNCALDLSTLIIRIVTLAARLFYRVTKEQAAFTNTIRDNWRVTSGPNAGHLYSIVNDTVFRYKMGEKSSLSGSVKLDELTKAINEGVAVNCDWQVAINSMLKDEAATKQKIARIIERTFAEKNAQQEQAKVSFVFSVFSLATQINKLRGNTSG